MEQDKPLSERLAAARSYVCDHIKHCQHRGHAEYSITHVDAINDAIDSLAGASLSAPKPEADHPSDPFDQFCDVDGCSQEGTNGGFSWNETGYWRTCSKHHSEWANGKPQPPMKPVAILRESRRGADGIYRYDDKLTASQPKEEEAEPTQPKWVKYSEREPALGGYYYCKVDTQQDDIVSVIVEWAEFRNGLNHSYYNWDLENADGDFGEDADVIEWLDESAEDAALTVEPNTYREALIESLRNEAANQRDLKKSSNYNSVYSYHRGQQMAYENAAEMVAAAFASPNPSTKS